MLPALGGKHIFASHPTAFGVQKLQFQPSNGVQKSPYSHLFPLRSPLGPVVSPFLRTMSPSRIAFSPMTCAYLSSMGALGPDLGPTSGHTEPAWSRKRVYGADMKPIVRHLSKKSPFHPFKCKTCFLPSAGSTFLQVIPLHLGSKIDISSPPKGCTRAIQATFFLSRRCLVASCRVFFAY